jgi:hypothetical protein
VICHFRGSVHPYFGRLGSDAVKCVSLVPVFGRNIVPRTRYVNARNLVAPAKLYGVITQNVAISIKWLKLRMKWSCSAGQIYVRSLNI